MTRRFLVSCLLSCLLLQGGCASGSLPLEPANVLMVVEEPSLLQVSFADRPGSPSRSISLRLGEGVKEVSLDALEDGGVELRWMGLGLHSLRIEPEALASAKGANQCLLLRRDGSHGRLRP